MRIGCGHWRRRLPLSPVSPRNAGDMISRRHGSTLGEAGWHLNFNRAHAQQSDKALIPAGGTLGLRQSVSVTARQSPRSNWALTHRS